MTRAPALAILLAAAPAAAYTTGISGYSGKDGKVCTECHNTPDSSKPKATLSGPTTLVAGASGTYTLLIETDTTTAATPPMARGAGLDVATSGGALGVLVQPNQTRLLNGEVSHTDRLAAAKQVQVMFSLKAPDAAGKITLFAAALSSNSDGTNQGDTTATTTFDVQITGGAPPDMAQPPADLSGVDLAGVDLAGADLAPPAPPDSPSLPDLSEPVDAVSSATVTAMPPPPPPGPPVNEARWECGSYVGRRPAVTAAPLLALLALAWLLRRARAR